MKKHLSILTKTAFLSVFLATVVLFSAAASGGIYLVDVTDMYSVTASGPTPQPTQPPGNAFNNHLGGNHKWYVTTAFTPPTMEIKFDTGEQLIQAYTLTTGADAHTRQPKEWVLSGWDGSDWVELDHRTDVAQRGANTKATYYILDNKTAYQDYKIDFLATNGATDFQVGEIELCRILQGQDVTNYVMPTITSNREAYSDAYAYNRLFDNQLTNSTKAVTKVPGATPDNPWTMTFTFPESISPDIIGYRIASAADEQKRDPAKWSFHAGADTTGAVIAPMEHDTAFFGRSSWLAFEANAGRQNQITWNITDIYNPAIAATDINQIGELEILEKVHIDRTNTNYMDVRNSVQVSVQNNNLGWYALDNSGTKWYTGAAADVTEDPWISLSLAGEPVITRYSITAVNESGQIGRNPQTWELQARNDAGEWDVLHKVTAADNINFVANTQTQYFDIANTAGYSDYRLVVNSTQDGRKDMQIRTLNLYEVTDLYQVSHLPDMVKITSTQGSASTGQSPEMLIDGNTGTKWFHNTPPTADAPHEIIFELQEAFAVQEYSLTTGGDDHGRDPSNWIFYGSEDGENWDILDLIDGVDFHGSARQESFSFLVDNDTLYDFYKFEFLATEGGGIQLGEIGLWAPLGQSSSATPEPATWAMLLAGLAGLMFIRRKANFTH